MEILQSSESCTKPSTKVWSATIGSMQCWQKVTRTKKKWPSMQYNYKHILMFLKEGFQLPAQYHIREVIENTNICLCYLKWIQHHKGWTIFQWVDHNYPLKLSNAIWHRRNGSAFGSRSGNSLALLQCQAITRTSADLLSDAPLNSLLKFDLNKLQLNLNESGKYPPKKRLWKMFVNC